jgi:hypothetical protein
MKLVSQLFGLSSSEILYSPRQLNKKVGNYSLLIGPNAQKSSISTGKFIPYPDQIPEEAQASPEGLPLAIRKILINNALQINKDRDKNPLLVLGGSLPDSSFADPASSAATLSYIANHPWIKSFSENDLRSMPGNVDPLLLPGKTVSRPEKEFTPSEILVNIPKSPEKNLYPLDNSIWASTLSLFAPLPPEPESLPSLRSNYSGQFGIAQAATGWSDNPQPRMDCQVDLDEDGIPECILASDNQFTVFDLEGGRLIAYYTIAESNLHQIIAPSTQFIIGLGDPSTWTLNAGEGSDPSGIHGAFVDGLPPWDFYDVSSDSDQLTFISPENRITKNFSLSENGLLVNYSSSDPISVQIPIAIDPWRRFSPNWRNDYACQPIDNGYSCRVTDGSTVEILSNSLISIHSFTDSLSHLHNPEDPNFNYPPGHYLPFPMVLIEIGSTETFSVQINSID